MRGRPTNQLIAAGLLANDKVDFSTLGDIEGATYRRNAVDRATLGDWDGANASMLGVANGPQELAAVQGQNLINNRFLTGGGGISTTEQGLAGIAADRDRSAAAYASANNFNASAARTRQAMGLDAAKYADQRNGGTLGNRPRGSAKPPSAAEMKAQQANATKTAQLGNVNRGLARIESALGDLGGALVDTGPVDQYLVRNTEAGQELDAAVGAIQNSMLALTRVPGVGSQSDLEARIAALQYPSLSNAPGVNARTLKQLKDFVEELQGNSVDASDTLGDAPPPANPRGPGLPKASGPAPGTVRNGYRFRGGNPKAAEALTNANQYHSRYVDQLENIDNIIGKKDGEAAYLAAVSGAKDGPTRIRSIMQTLPENEKKMVTSAFIRRMGRAVPGQQDSENSVFSMNTFPTNWANTSPEARKVLFGSYGPEFTRNMETIAKATSRIREGSKVFSNPSGTGGRAALIGQVAGTASTAGALTATGNPGLAFITVASSGLGAAGANVISRIITSPKYVNWLARTTEKPHGELLAQLQVLRGIAGRS